MSVFGTTNYWFQKVYELCEFHNFTTLFSISNYAYPRLSVATELYRSTLIKLTCTEEYISENEYDIKNYIILYQILTTFTMLPQKNVCGTKEFTLIQENF